MSAVGSVPERGDRPASVAWAAHSGSSDCGHSGELVRGSDHRNQVALLCQAFDVADPGDRVEEAVVCPAILRERTLVPCCDAERISVQQSTRCRGREEDCRAGEEGSAVPRRAMLWRIACESA